MTDVLVSEIDFEAVSDKGEQVRRLQFGLLKYIKFLDELKIDVREIVIIKIAYTMLKDRCP